MASVVYWTHLTFTRLHNYFVLPLKTQAQSCKSAFYLINEFHPSALPCCLYMLNVKNRYWMEHKGKLTSL